MANRLVLTPFWGMWMANVLFTAMGFVLMVRVQRSGATARSTDWRERIAAAARVVGGPPRGAPCGARRPRGAP